MLTFEFTTLGLIGGAVLMLAFAVACLARPFLYHTIRILGFAVGLPLLGLAWIVARCVAVPWGHRVSRRIAARSAARNSPAN